MSKKVHQRKLNNVDGDLITISASLLDSDVEFKNFMGRDYLVFPVVALVEGVRFGSLQEYAEYVPAAVLAQYPEMWDGRPIVVDHPEGCVSGSSEEVLSSTYIGKMMNTYVNGGKLITEAWIDVQVIENSSNELVQDMKSRLWDGEVVEVSIGALVHSRIESGIYNGGEYGGVWEIVVPGHMALLSSQIGACSIVDGCGTFRQYNTSSIQFCGGGLEKVKSMSDKKTVEIKKPAVVTPCSGNSGNKVELNVKNISLAARQELIESLLFSVDSYNTEKKQYLQLAVKKEYSSDSYVYAYNDSYVIFDLWDGETYSLKRDLYESTDMNKVTLLGSPEDIISVSKFIPVDTILSGGEVKKKKKEKTMSKKDVVTGNKNSGDSVTTPTTLSDVISLVGADTHLGKQLTGWRDDELARRKELETSILSGDSVFTGEMLSSMDMKSLSAIAEDRKRLKKEIELSNVKSSGDFNSGNVVSYEGAAGKTETSSSGSTNKGRGGSVSIMPQVEFS